MYSRKHEWQHVDDVNMLPYTAINALFVRRALCGVEGSVLVVMCGHKRCGFFTLR